MTQLSQAEEVMLQAELTILGHIAETGDIDILSSFRDTHREVMTVGQWAFDLANGNTSPDELDVAQPDLMARAREQAEKAKKPEVWPKIWHRHFAAHHAPLLTAGYYDLLKAGNATIADIARRFQELEPIPKRAFKSVLDWTHEPDFLKSGGRRPTGISSIDWIMDGGIPDDDVTIIAGLTSYGKSALAESIMTNWAREGWRGLYVVFEMSGPGTSKRFLAQEVTGLRIRDFRDIDPAQLDGIRQEAAAQELITVEKPDSRDWPFIRTLIKAYVEQYPESVGIALDYFQQMTHSELRRETQEQQLKAVAEEFGSMCRTHGKSGLLLAQMDGRMEKDRKPNADGTPAMPSEYSVRYCKGAAEAAGAFIAIGNLKPEGYPEYEDASKRYLFNLKNRGGAGAGLCAPAAFFPHKTLWIGDHDPRYPFPEAP